MKIIVFDTETTWFIDKKTTDLTKQPHIIQFAWIIWDLENWIFTEIKRINQLFKPPIPIPYDSSQVHHIYDIDVKNSPEIKEFLDNIIFEINSCDVVIWHNIEYDEDMIKLELKRLWKDYDYKPKQVLCTMKTTVDYCALKWNWERFKYPKLWELHKKVFWEYFVWAHDAIVDVEATLKIFLELYKNNIVNISPKKQQILSLF